MFRRIISNLSFSPALVGQLGFYAKRLRKEEATRRLGLVFTALALVVQSFAVFSPPEAANAASPADFISGGISSKQALLNHYDNNTNRIKGLYTSLGITRAEIAAMKTGTINASGVAGKYNWSRTSLYSAAQGQRSYTFNNGAGNVTFFYRPLALTAAKPPYKVLIGHSAQFGWFAVKMDCGNLITATPPNREASCQALIITPLSPTRFRLTGKATVKDGAKVKSYTFIIKRGSTVLKNQTIKDTNLSHDLIYDQSIPGTYHARVILDTSEGNNKTNANCTDSFPVSSTPPPVIPPTPMVVCSSLKAPLITRNTVSLEGNATATNGGVVKRYLFVVKNSSGKVVKQIPVQSSNEHVVAESFQLEPGEYSVMLNIDSSVGNGLTGPACATSVKIAPPEVCPYNPSLAPSDTDCQPCPGNTSIWIKDKDCKANIITSKTSLNMTNGSVDATTVAARPSDKISYTITATNKGLTSESITMTENLADVLEYATLIDKGGGTFNDSDKTLSWPATSLAPGQKQSRTIAIQVMSQVPSTNTGTSNSDSYDCKMINTFGNSVAIDVQCPPEKTAVEQVVKELPTTGPGENMLFAAVLFAVVAYFYARSRQLGTEVRLIRRNLNTGTI